MSTVHLICGSIGAGKTTYALKLCEQLGAMPFSIDDWMVTLFAPDMTEPYDWAWIIDRTTRCEKQIMAAAIQLGRRGIASVFDLGLLTADHRQRIATQAAAGGLAVRLHFIDTQSTERWRRVAVRNVEKGESFRLTISRDMFAFIDTIWQAPTPEELEAFNGVRIESGLSENVTRLP